jgi:hypothetical protein
MISTLEVLLLLVGGIALLSFAYSSFWSFSIRKALYGKIYRQRALWTGSFAAYSALEIALIVYFPYVTGLLAVDIVWLVLGSAILFILIAWISSTVKVVISLDPFHRNLMKWRQSEKLVWLVSGIIVAMNVVPALVLLGYKNYVPSFALLDNVQFALYIAFFIYLIFVVVAYHSMMYDKLLKAYLEYFLYLLMALMLDIALSPVAFDLGLFIGPFALTDSLLILSAFFIYRMAKSLVPVIAKNNL